MAKKGLFVLLIVVIGTGAVFAQNNTVTVDFGPTIAGIILGTAGDIVDVEGFKSSSGFGIGAQYERDLSKNLSFAARFAFLQSGFSFERTEDYFDGGGLQIVDGKAELGMDFSSFSFEGHLRYYPSAGSFFLGGMLGYAYMKTMFSGDVIITDLTNGQNRIEDVERTAIRNFFKTGVKLGWRIDFGRPGGFIFEPAFGYYFGVGSGDTVGTQLASTFVGDLGYSDYIDDISNALEKLIFVGGPRATFSFGWRF
ncbi:MAG: outer membrane beta-barrel protein [Treponema sp.]|nr:outer membrane beta-barrel protein [Treponema sp.]